MSAPEMVHRFASAILKSAGRISIDERRVIGGTTHKKRWDGDDFRKFLTNLWRITEDEYYGLSATPCPTGVSRFGLQLLVVGDALGKALERCFEFYRIAAPGVRFLLSETEGLARIEIVLADPSLDIDHFLIEYNARRWQGLVQWLIGEEVTFDRIDFSHAPQGPLSEYVQVFGDNCFFNQERTFMVFPANLLQRRVIRTEGDLSMVAAYDGYDPLDLGDTERRWRSLLKEAVVASLTDMQPIPTLEEVAARFGVCSQTLRRRLRAEGSSYRAVKAEARREIILAGISDETLSLGKVSMMAGFAEPNGLVRAIRSWTGLSPTEYRRSSYESIKRPTRYRCPHCNHETSMN